jgi:tetratricopeptide (TPR) repeat protein/predicted Ser/Thr protein kinase
VTGQGSDDAPATKPLFVRRELAVTATARDPVASTADVAVDTDVDTKLPTSIGRFEIVSKLGEGGMGVVLLATDPMLNRKVALKVLRASQRAGDDGRRRLLREAQGVAKLVHENVVVVHEVGQHDGQIYVAMEYVAGTTLGRWQKTRGWLEVLAIYLRAGRGLEAAHAAGLVHRDFKPDNVLVGDDGRVRVSDFGLVASIGDTEPRGPSSAPSELSASLTRTGMVVGTPRYMAPEQYSAAAVDARADQFAFCVALYEALYRKPPFPGESSTEICERVLAGDITPVPADSDVPPIVRDAVLRGLRRAPAERFPSMKELLATLARADMQPVAEARSPRRWRRALIVAGAGLVVATGVFVVAWESRGGAPKAAAGSAAAGSAAAGSAAGSAARPDDENGVWSLGVSEEQQARGRQQFAVGNEHLKLGEYDKAIAAYQDALRDWPHPSIHYNLAITYLSLNRAKDALLEFDAALAYPSALGAGKADQARRYRKLLIEQMRAGQGSGSATR